MLISYRNRTLVKREEIRGIYPTADRYSEVYGLRGFGELQEVLTNEKQSEYKND